MKKLTCIVCPNGCSLVVNGTEDNLTEITVTGNNCPRGAVYAQEEICFPKRVVTATCTSVGGDFSVLRRIPVRTNVPCPKEKIPGLLADIYRTKVTLPVKIGDIIIADWEGCGIDVVASRNVTLRGE